MDGERVINLRGVDPELFKEVKHAAIDAGMTMKDWIVLAMREMFSQQQAKAAGIRTRYPSGYGQTHT
ncbi:MAG: hypothetical protein HYX72_01770 [Acidobacteria bacterium]|nr:hypothetical protein [Acidobacteriota bacterium]